jgi:putative aminopeptidase FrvX
MKRLVLSLFCLFSAPVLPAQNLGTDLSEFVRTPAVTGYERPLAEKIRARIPASLGSPQYDNMGNLYLSIGSGAPHRLIVAPMDEPGYVVSAITDDGYLRVQRLPQTAPHPLFDHLHEAQPVQIHTRSGKYVTGVVAGLSIHLQGGRRNPPVVSHPDSMYIDVGASSAAEVRKAGVDVLDPLAIAREPYALNLRLSNGASNGDRFGAAVLTEIAHRLDPRLLRGTLTIAFVAQRWANSRGLDRLLQHIRPDEMVYLGRLLRSRRDPGAQAQASNSPRREPGSGVLFATEKPGEPLSGLAAELAQLAAQRSIPFATDFSASLPRVSYTQGPVLPARFAHLGVAVAWPLTPAEILDRGDVMALAGLLSAWVGATGGPRPSIVMIGDIPASPRPTAALSMQQLLEQLVETYGVSGAEDLVRATVAHLLPAWAKPETDESGNLILRLPAGPAARGKAKRIVFVAHMDEIGYVVESIADDGRLILRSRGAGSPQFYLGHGVRLHPQSRDTNFGVLELPDGWDQADFQWPRGPQAGAIRLNIGAHSPEEVHSRGVRVGDTVTIHKKFRPLLGRRATGRSFDDRVGCAALIHAVWALGRTTQGTQAMPASLPAEIIFIWATREEVGLEGALESAARMAAASQSPDYVFAVDTFVSSDSPLESRRFANAPIGKGFVIRAVDNSNIAPREEVEKLIRLARAHNIPVQFGVTGGGNDGAAFTRHGAVDLPISWPLRYSHSPGEVIDLRDADALARIVELISRRW